MKAKIEMCASSYESYGFKSEDEARKFFSRAAVSGTSRSVGFFAGDPNRPNYAIGFALKAP